MKASREPKRGVAHFISVRSAIALLILALVTVGCRGPIEGLYPPRQGEHVVEVLVVNNHWHTGFVLSYAQLSPRLRRLLASFRDELWVEIGWGDAAFYPAPRATSGLALHAMCFSRGSVLHVAGFDEPPIRRYRAYSVELY